MAWKKERIGKKVEIYVLTELAEQLKIEEVEEAYPEQNDGYSFFGC